MKIIECNPVERSNEISKIKDKAVKSLDVPSGYFTESTYTEFLEENSKFFLGIKNGQIVATGGYKILNEDVKSKIDRENVAEFKNMHVLPEYQRNGFGQKIMDKLIEESKKDGYENAVLEATNIQTVACNFYEKNGFKNVNEEKIEGFDKSFKNMTYFRSL